MGICRDNLTKQSFRELILGIPWQGPQAKAGDVVTELYTKPEESEALIKSFAKKYATVGK